MSAVPPTPRALLLSGLLLAGCGHEDAPPPEGPPPVAGAEEASQPPSDTSPLPSRVQHEPSGIVLIRVPAGTFLMGSPPDEHLRDEDERQREVRIERDFYLSETEVTAEQWARVMGSWHEPREEGPEMPVNNTTWYEAVEFVERLNAMGAGGWRLPSEAEWEYACRAGTSTPFAFGEDVTPSQVHYNPRNPYHHETPRGVRPKGSVPVRTLPPNPWGFYGMHGNVQEWCQDLYHVDPDVPAARAPEEGDPRVFKGGAWVSPADQVRSAYRDGYPPKSDGVEYGFRVARSVSP